MKDEAIILLPHDPAWSARFARERSLLQGEIGRFAPGGIHHVGSTAVPGLPAKPIVDILVGVESLAASRNCFGRLEGLGYLYAPYLPEQMHWFCKPDPSRREFHLHLVPVGSPRYEDELAFRDLLRDDPLVADEYAELKRGLAERFPRDREAYTEAKGDFIGRMIHPSTG